MSETKENESVEDAPAESKPEPETIKDRNERVRAEAAQKRRARREREQAAAAPRRNLDAGEMVDDALARSTHAAAGFLRRHFNKLQWAIMAGLVAWIAWEVYSWRHNRQAEKSTAALFNALSAETGKVGDGAPADAADEDDARRKFKSDEERLKAAQKEYLLASSSVTPVSVVLADFLGAAGVAYDLGQYKEAESAFEKVKKHAAFGTDNDIRGRTLEGLGMALEAQKKDDAAIKAFRELASMDNANFSALGRYHQARLLKAQGKNEDAIKELDKAIEKLVLLKDTPGAIKYLRMSVLELLEGLDPKKARELQQKLLPADILKQLQDSATRAGVSPGGGTPMPMPVMPPAPIEDAPQAPLPEEAPPPTAPGPLRDDAPAPPAAPDAPAPAPSGAP